ncbi:MAG: acetolactate synthase small subunit [Lachnospiraceae bacterium]|jgi:acetolactate synthase-1/3 small subunit|nr:acetolactate synthase small subunit [Lachnospiraceae bacterium]
MKKIFSVLVENRSGVLSKVSGLFARRSYNIDTLTVGETNDKTISHMTICSSGSKWEMEQIEKQLNKKLDVIKVRTFEEQNAILKEIILVKIKYTAANRGEILEICQLTKAEIVDSNKDYMIIYLCAEPDKTTGLLDMLGKFNITECCRTGTLAMSKCSLGE